MKKAKNKIATRNYPVKNVETAFTMTMRTIRTMESVIRLLGDLEEKCRRDIANLERTYRQDMDKYHEKLPEIVSVLRRQKEGSALHQWTSVQMKLSFVIPADEVETRRKLFLRESRERNMIRRLQQHSLAYIEAVKGLRRLAREEDAMRFTLYKAEEEAFKKIWTITNADRWMPRIKCFGRCPLSVGSRDVVRTQFMSMLPAVTSRAGRGRYSHKENDKKMPLPSLCVPDAASLSSSSTDFGNSSLLPLSPRMAECCDAQCRVHRGRVIDTKLSVRARMLRRYYGDTTKEGFEEVCTAVQRQKCPLRDFVRMDSAHNNHDHGIKLEHVGNIGLSCAFVSRRNERSESGVTNVDNATLKLVHGSARTEMRYPENNDQETAEPLVTVIGDERCTSPHCILCNSNIMAFEALPLYSLPHLTAK